MYTFDMVLLFEGNVPLKVGINKCVYNMHNIIWKRIDILIILKNKESISFGNFRKIWLKFH